ncbi:unnamed protein product [Rangifer tarandus platyrhynchus]|uniref:Uncharacterized protein n=2 Tax=Rangifer tarandus platyrhynchus TaxID=3082113 RepID=A0ACB1KHA0_RANTA|nr:unnamed protein product [Rangifer tarandus platyrhynchus]
MPPALFFFLKIASAIWGSFVTPYTFLDCFYISVENVSRTFIGIALNLWMPLGSKGILAILIILIHELGICFHLCLLQFLSSKFLVYRSFISLVKFIPKYLIVFDAVVNGKLFHVLCC